MGRQKILTSLRCCRSPRRAYWDPHLYGAAPPSLASLASRGRTTRDAGQRPWPSTPCFLSPSTTSDLFHGTSVAAGLRQGCAPPHHNEIISRTLPRPACGLGSGSAPGSPDTVSNGRRNGSHPLDPEPPLARTPLRRRGQSSPQIWPSAFCWGGGDTAETQSPTSGHGLAGRRVAPWRRVASTAAGHRPREVHRAGCAAESIVYSRPAPSSLFARFPANGLCTFRGRPFIYFYFQKNGGRGRQLREGGRAGQLRGR